MFRRGVAWLVAVVLFVVAPGLLVLPAAVAADPVVENVVTFSDVPTESQFATEISWLAASGISTGWDVGGVRQYRPLESIARDAMAAFLYRHAGSPAFDAPVESPFTDVPAGAAFYKEITWLASEGISTGWDLGAGKREYRPLSPIARDAMAAFLYRYADKPAFAAPVVSPFSDVPAGGGFYAEITWLSASGISTGWDVGNGVREYRPLNGIARDAMAAFLYRYAGQKAPADPGNPAAGTVTVAPDVEVLDPSQLETALVSADTVVLPSDQALEIKPNDVLVSGVTTGTPDGLLVRVVQIVRDPGGNTLVKTKPATLPEAVVSTGGLLEVTATPVSSEFIPEAGVTVTTPATPLERSQALIQDQGNVFSQSFTLKETYKAEIGNDKLHGFGSASVEASFKAAAKAKMTLETGLLKLKEASVVLTPSFTSEQTVSVTGGLEGTISAKLGVLKAGLLFWAGPVPIVVTADAQVAANLTLAGEAEISVTSSQTVAADYGFKYREGSFNLINSKPQSSAVKSDVKATASLTVRLSLDFDADIKLYGVAGLTFGSGPFVSGAISVIDSGGTKTWSCPFVFGFESRLGVVVGVEVMGFKLEKSQVATLSWNLTDLDPCEGTPVTAPIKSPPLKITSASVPQGHVGQSYSKQLTATGGEAPYTWGISTGTLPKGLVLEPSAGTISGTPTTAATTNLTIKVTDNRGEMAYLDVVLTVAGTGTAQPGRIKEMASNDASTVALTEEGTVWAWGANDYGQLGNGTAVDSSVPVQVSGLYDVKSVTATGSTAFALRSDGTVWAWGSNSYGQLGGWGSENYGQVGPGSTTGSTIPVQVDGISGVQALTATDFATVFALKSDGTVWTWGWNYYGQLGNGTYTKSAVPVQVKGLTGVQSLTPGRAAFAQKADGTVWAWGYNEYGQLGNGTTANSSVPVQVVGLMGTKSIVAEQTGTVALKTDGSVWAWGDNYYGLLGDGTHNDSATPVQVKGLSEVQAVASDGGTGTAVKADGTMWVWGGSLETTPKPPTVELSGVQAVVYGSGSRYAIKSDGTVWSWGSNYAGQLGLGLLSYDYGNIPYVKQPTQILAPTGVLSVFYGHYAVFAIEASGTAWAWGHNWKGRLGIGSLDGPNAPVAVKGFKAP